jgi:hypothetical protein
MIDGEGVDDPLLSEVWWDDVLPWPQQPKLRHHGRVWLLFLELCEKWDSESAHYLLHCDARKQKKSDEQKFESSYQKISSIWKIFAYAFSVWLSFFLSRVTIFKFEHETKIITQ